MMNWILASAVVLACSASSHDHWNRSSKHKSRSYLPFTSDSSSSSSSQDRVHLGNNTYLKMIDLESKDRETLVVLGKPLTYCPTDKNLVEVETRRGYYAHFPMLNADMMGVQRALHWLRAEGYRKLVLVGNGGYGSAQALRNSMHGVHKVVLMDPGRKSLEAWSMEEFYAQMRKLAKALGCYEDVYMPPQVYLECIAGKAEAPQVADQIGIEWRPVVDRRFVFSDELPRIGSSVSVLSSSKEKECEALIVTKTLEHDLGIRVHQGGVQDLLSFSSSSYSNSQPSMNISNMNMMQAGYMDQYERDSQAALIKMLMQEEEPVSDDEKEPVRVIKIKPKKYKKIKIKLKKTYGNDYPYPYPMQSQEPQWNPYPMQRQEPPQWNPYPMLQRQEPQWPMHSQPPQWNVPKECCHHHHHYYGSSGPSSKVQYKQKYSTKIKHSGEQLDKLKIDSSLQEQLQYINMQFQDQLYKVQAYYDEDRERLKEKLRETKEKLRVAKERLYMIFLHLRQENANVNKQEEEKKPEVRKREEEVKQPESPKEEEENQALIMVVQDMQRKHEDLMNMIVQLMQRVDQQQHQQPLPAPPPVPVDRQPPVTVNIVTSDPQKNVDEDRELSIVPYNYQQPTELQEQPQEQPPIQSPPPQQQQLPPPPQQQLPQYYPQQQQQQPQLLPPPQEQLMLEYPQPQPIQQPQLQSIQQPPTPNMEDSSNWHIVPYQPKTPKRITVNPNRNENAIVVFPKDTEDCSVKIERVEPPNVGQNVLVRRNQNPTPGGTDYNLPD